MLGVRLGVVGILARAKKLFHLVPGSRENNTVCELFHLVSISRGNNTVRELLHLVPSSRGNNTVRVDNIQLLSSY